MGENLKKIAVVVGANGNLGKAVCRQLKKNNFIIDPVWQTNNRPNVTNDLAFSNLPKKIHTAIYIAGINKILPFENFTNKDFYNVINVNLISAVNFFKSAFPSLKRAKSSSCIVISSIMVSHPYPGRAPYAVSKSGLETLMKCLCVEWSKYGISTHAIRLGHLSKLMKSSKTSANLLKSVKNITPRKKLISINEVAKYIAFLSDGACSSVSGSVTEMDAGYTINRWPLKTN
jgi:3-hydroxybutyrate dehydrogenase